MYRRPVSRSHPPDIICCVRACLLAASKGFTVEGGKLAGPLAPLHAGPADPPEEERALPFPLVDGMLEAAKASVVAKAAAAAAAAAAAKAKASAEAEAAAKAARILSLK